MMTSILNNADAVSPQLTTYRYDQLNRIKELNAYRNGTLSGNDWSGAINDSSYRSKMSYDANGNIEYMLTNGNVSGDGKRMDELKYVYENKDNGYDRNTNKLRQVTDNASTSIYTDDIESQISNNYIYDEIGNLIHDENEEIENIDWTVYGKIKSITRKPASAKPNLEFTYDASGNRTSKIVKPRSGGVVLPESEWTTTYYTRDASGNVMATYEKKSLNSAIDLYLQEQHLFGSSRAGVQTRNLNLTTPPANTANIFAREVGQKDYELSNHLGNVLTTVSDKRIPRPGTGGVIDHYDAVVKSSKDYYAFGAQMSGRGKNGTYRYGFNGKENDKEVVGTGQGTQDYGMRIYNPSLGRFLSVDPLASEYPWNSVYAFAENDVIRCVDLDGGERKSLTDHLSVSGSMPAIGLVTYSLDWLTEGFFDIIEGGIENAANEAAYIAPQEHGNGSYGKVPDKTLTINHDAADISSKTKMLTGALKVQERFGYLQTAAGVGVGLTSLLTAESFAPITRNAQTKTSPTVSIVKNQASGNGGNTTATPGGRAIIVDQNLSPSLVLKLREKGINAIRFKDGTLDADIIEFAKNNDAIVATNNIKDFRNKGVATIEVKQGPIMLKENIDQLVKKLSTIYENNPPEKGANVKVHQQPD